MVHFCCDSNAMNNSLESPKSEMLLDCDYGNVFCSYALVMGYAELDVSYSMGSHETKTLSDRMFRLQFRESVYDFGHHYFV